LKTAGDTIRDLQVAEVAKRDIHLDEGWVVTFRTKLELSFRYNHRNAVPVDLPRGAASTMPHRRNSLVIPGRMLVTPAATI
jgi:hypothetical protein